MHNINNVEKLYNDATHLYKDLVVNGESGADAILYKLVEAIENLKTNWKGADAGLWIQNAIEVHNAMVSVRNALAELASNAVMTAVMYRNIHIANKVSSSELQALNYDVKGMINSYMDNADRVYVSPEVKNGQTNIDLALKMLENFTNQVKYIYDEIMDNWTQGPKRDSANEAFVTFLSSVGKYREKLENVSLNITTALNNYGV